MNETANFLEVPGFVRGSQNEQGNAPDTFNER